jgi:hypothetical protein
VKGILTSTTGNTLGDLGLYARKDSADSLLYEAMRITSGSLNVGIGTTSPWRKFGVNGTVSFVGLTTAAGTPSALCLSSDNEVTVNTGAPTCTVSSLRFKHNVENLTEGTDFIRALRPVSFTYNGTNEESVGFIAEEIALLDPRLVTYETVTTTNADGSVTKTSIPRSVRYENLTAVIVKALQEMEVRITALEQSLVAGVGTLSDFIAAHLTVGSASSPSGITLFDQTTGAPYCVVVRNGTLYSEAGTCGTASGTPPADTPPANTPPADTPPAETPPADTPPADTPPVDTPPADTPPADTPPAETPPADTPPADTPPAETPPADTLPADTPTP